MIEFDVSENELLESTKALIQAIFEVCLWNAAVKAYKRGKGEQQ